MWFEFKKSTRVTNTGHVDTLKPKHRTTSGLTLMAWFAWPVN
jgi:hypothetical protein